MMSFRETRLKSPGKKKDKKMEKRGELRVQEGLEKPEGSYSISKIIFQ
jgi:hypothetical protein